MATHEQVSAGAADAARCALQRDIQEIYAHSRLEHVHIFTHIFTHTHEQWSRTHTHIHTHTHTHTRRFLRIRQMQLDGLDWDASEHVIAGATADGGGIR